LPGNGSDHDSDASDAEVNQEKNQEKNPTGAHHPHTGQQQALTPAILRLQLLKWAGGVAGPATEHSVVLPVPHISAKLFTASMASVVEGTNCSARNECVLHLEVSAVVGTRHTVLATNNVYLTPFNQVTTMQDPGLAVHQVVAAGSSPRPSHSHYSDLAVFNVTVTAAVVPAPFVWLETELPGRWSDNGMLLTDATVHLQWFTDDANVTADQLAATLSVRSLVDVARGYNSSSISD
jgi:hypothetical protein